MTGRELRRLMFDCEMIDSAAIRGTLPNGEEVDIAHVVLDGYEATMAQWVVFFERDDDAHTATKTRVENLLKRCDPDVKIITEEQSRFPVRE